jgi:glycosyltransferase involved in cell wall biosynthesis
MIRKLKSKFFGPNNKVQIEGLKDKIESIRKENDSIVLFGSPTEGNWKGIANATTGLFPINSLEIPQWYSNSIFTEKETIEICVSINEARFKKVIISGFAPYFFIWIELLYSIATIEVIFHGTISEFHEPEKQKFVSKLIQLGQTNVISRFGFVKEGLDKVFSSLYGFETYHQPLTLLQVPPGIKKLDLDRSKIHIGVFGADTFNKNLHNQVIHALMIENAMVHVLDKSVFEYLNLSNRIVEHGKNLPREVFLSILGSMDLNLYMSFNESWGLVAYESEAMGVPCISQSDIDYLQLINAKLKK